MSSSAEGSRSRSVESLVSSIAALLQRSPALSTGDIAALRRMDPRTPVAAFFKIEGILLNEHLPADAAARFEAETRWATIVLGLAHLGDLYGYQHRLGMALATAGFSELRFVRLLQADAEQLLDELPALARFLVAKEIPADWSAAARLILSAGRSDEEIARRRLAREYYSVLARQDAV